MSRNSGFANTSYFLAFTYTVAIAIRSYDTKADPLFHEDNSRNIDRIFDVRATITFTPQNELYARFGIQYTAKTEVLMHMGLFLEWNYRSLREHGVKPLCSTDPKDHNPIWWQRGYEKFNYYGYTAAQIFPKAGDLLKAEYDNRSPRTWT